MASCSWSCPDIYSWIHNLPPIPQWKTNSMSICLCHSTDSNPFLNLSVTKNHKSSALTFSIIADFNLPISLWLSKPFKINPKSPKLDEQTIHSLTINFIQDVLSYGSSSNNNNSSSPHIKIPKPESIPGFNDIFNLAFLTLTLLICVYEAPETLQFRCLNTLKEELIHCPLRAASRQLMKMLGSNIEEQWMRSVNLAITSYITEKEAKNLAIMTPSPLFSYAISRSGLWKVQVYCPLIAMDVEKTSNSSANEELLFSLNYHQLEGVIQLNYKVIVQEKWINVMVNTDNIRFDVFRLINETLMNEKGVGAEEKHFPSRISLQITPIDQTNILTVSVSKSSQNPVQEIGKEKGIETSLNPSSLLSLKLSAGETTTMSTKPWKFEQSVHGYSGTLNWFLHDIKNGREVFSSKPSIFAMINPSAWFKNRYSSTHRPFTRRGGVIFAGDEYGETIWWKVDRSAMGKKMMEWEIKGSIWLTYWPNKHKTFYNETRRLEFREILELNFA